VVQVVLVAAVVPAPVRVVALQPRVLLRPLVRAAAPLVLRAHPRMPAMPQPVGTVLRPDPQAQLVGTVLRRDPQARLVGTVLRRDPQARLVGTAFRPDL
jgi:hypothetical protein